MSTNATKRPINIYSETFSLCKRTFLSRSLVPIDEDIVPVWLFRGFENLVRVRCSGGTMVVFSNLLKVLFCNMENMIFFQFLISVLLQFSFLILWLFPLHQRIRKIKFCDYQAQVDEIEKREFSSLHESFIKVNTPVKREWELFEVDVTRDCEDIYQNPVWNIILFILNRPL